MSKRIGKFEGLINKTVDRVERTETSLSNQMKLLTKAVEDNSEAIKNKKFSIFGKKDWLELPYTKRLKRNAPLSVCSGLHFVFVGNEHLWLLTLYSLTWRVCTWFLASYVADCYTILGDTTLSHRKTSVNADVIPDVNFQLIEQQPLKTQK